MNSLSILAASILFISLIYPAFAQPNDVASVLNNAQKSLSAHDSKNGSIIAIPGNANAIGAHKMGVRITTPSGNTTVPAGQFTIHGISSDTIKTNCRVYVDWNDLKPMQNVTAKGSGGANDYSNWTYTYTEKYHIIAPGTNELTSKITCFDNPSNITSKYYSINITGLKNNISP
jgi:hypothetical protein